MVNEACNKIQQVCMEIWNSKSSSNMYSKLKWNLEHFLKSILGKLNIILKLEKLGIQHFKWCTNQNWKEEVMCLKQTSQRGMLSLKLATWIQNAFLPFRTQRNARKLLAEANCESSSLFWIRGIHFKPKNMENLNGKRVSLKFTMNFELVILISNWTFFFLLISSKLI